MDKVVIFCLELFKYLGIEKVVFISQVLLISENQGIVISWEGYLEGVEFLIYCNWVDYNYFDFFGIELLNGCNFFFNYLMDVIIVYLLNEVVVKVLGWKDVVGKFFEEGKVIGVVKNFYFQFFKLSIEFMFICIYNEYIFCYGNIVVKISGDQQQEVIVYLEKSMKEIFLLIFFNFCYFDVDY